MKESLSLRYPVNTLTVNDCSSVNITTSAYLELIAAITKGVSAVRITNSSGRDIKIATGASGAEVDYILVPTAKNSGIVPVNWSAGTRISAKAFVGSAVTGVVAIEYYG